MKFTQGQTILVLCVTFLGCHGHSVSKLRHVAEIGEPEEVRLAPALPTVVVSCAASYTRAIADFMTVLDKMGNFSIPVAKSVHEMIGTLCRADFYFGLRFVGCVQLDLPRSSYFIDRVLMSAINISTLPGILYGGCNITKELGESLPCIIGGVRTHPNTMRCLTDVELFFQNLLNNTGQLEAAVQEFCRVWGTMIMCVTPYISMCNPQLGRLWALYGREVLNEECQNYAFPSDNEMSPTKNGIVHDIFGMFHTNKSAISFCASEHNRNIRPYLPTAIIDPAGLAYNAVWGFESACGNPMQEFMYCMDERRLNSTSPVDKFMFKVISTVNMRTAYNKLCSQMELVKNSVNCLISSPLEVQMCMCHLTDLIHRVMDQSTQGLQYDQMIGPFCSFYTNFADCYISLLGTCSHDLGLLMQEVYLGPLTTECLKAEMAPCGLDIQDQNSKVLPSVFLQCGTKVSEYVTQVTMETNATIEIEEMMQNMENLVINAYNFTCGLGNEILDCMEGNLTSSASELDKLLVLMFDTSKFSFIWNEGCNQTLISDLKFRLQYILSMIFSDHRVSSCIDALNSFRDVVEGKVDMDVPSAMDPYCRTWGDFSECIEAKLSCSSPDLASRWRQFTVDSMNMECRLIAMHQQEISAINRTCDRNNMDDSALSLCGMSFMASYMAHSNNHPDRNLQELILDEIHYFCKNDMYEAEIMVDCLRSTVPTSSMTIDMVTDRIYDWSTIDAIPTKVCSLTQDLEKHVACIADSMDAWEDTENCVKHLKNGFNVTNFQKSNTTLTELVDRGCKGWEDFSHCILPHINACDINLSSVWSNLTYMVLTDQCQTYIARTVTETGQQRNPATCGSYNLFLMLISVLLTLSLFRNYAEFHHHDYLVN